MHLDLAPLSTSLIRTTPVSKKFIVPSHQSSTVIIYIFNRFRAKYTSTAKFEMLMILIEFQNMKVNYIYQLQICKK